MTDYNDGEWHLWDGSDRLPDGVHPESLVTYFWHNERTGGHGLVNANRANRSVWRYVLKFRVTKPHREPRVIWVNEYPSGDDCTYSTEDGARRASAPHATRVAVRYVEAPE